MLVEDNTKDNVLKIVYKFKYKKSKLLKLAKWILVDIVMQWLILKVFCLLLEVIMAHISIHDKNLIKNIKNGLIIKV